VRSLPRLRAYCARVAREKRTWINAAKQLTSARLQRLL